PSARDRLAGGVLERVRCHTYRGVSAEPQARGTGSHRVGGHRLDVAKDLGLLTARDRRLATLHERADHGLAPGPLDEARWRECEDEGESGRERDEPARDVRQVGAERPQQRSEEREAEQERSRGTGANALRRWPGTG